MESICQCAWNTITRTKAFKGNWCSSSSSCKCASNFGQNPSMGSLCPCACEHDNSETERAPKVNLVNSFIVRVVNVHQILDKICLWKFCPCGVNTITQKTERAPSKAPPNNSFGAPDLANYLERSDSIPFRKRSDLPSSGSFGAPLSKAHLPDLHHLERSDLYLSDSFGALRIYAIRLTLPPYLERHLTSHSPDGQFI
ncbi:hypothetical protein AVEN_137181-1 [Araneus ventricosus]|uniref:Uncharacterized protein n=1 Tax=Araneus ventricosus TaxID=182803 RepID=A0A4Y2VQI4_ARAVE|nr:hypothetical protein AVEN_137181-1 [Araneus ventricosus]